MAKYNHLQASLSYGQLSTKMKTRTDLEQYEQGLDIAKNYLGYKQGGAFRRPGSMHLLDFANIQERNGGSALNFGKPDCVIPYGDDFVLIGQGTDIALIKLSDGTYQDIADRDYLTNDLTTYFVEARSESYSGPDADMPLPDLSGCIDYTQVGDLLFITKEGFFPMILRPEIFTSPATQNSMVTFILQWAIDPLINPATFLVPLDPTGIASSDFPKHALFQPYNSPNVNRNETVQVLNSSQIRFNNVFPFGNQNAKGTQVKITGNFGGTIQTVVFRIRDIASTTATTITYNGVIYTTQLTSTTATDNWQIGAWNPVDGYPTSVTSFEQRLIYGQNDRLFGSETRDLVQFMVDRLAQDAGQTSDVSGAGYFGDPSDSDPFDFIISASDPNPIRWLYGGNGIEIGTTGPEYFATGGQSALSRSSVTVNSQSSIGSSLVRPAKMGKYTVYIDKAGKFIYGYHQSESASSVYKSNQLDLFSENLWDDERFTRIAWQDTISTGWFLTDGGNVLAMTYHEDVGVRFFSPACFEDTEGIVCDLFVAGDFSYFIIENNGRVHLERIGQEYRKPVLYPSSVTGAFAEDAPYFLDNSIYQVFSPSTAIITGLAHLEGETVSVLADGVPYNSSFVVSGGQITLPVAANEVLVGIPYLSKLCTLNPEKGGAFGTALGSPRRNHEAWVYFERSAALAAVVKSGASANFSENIAKASNPDKLDEATPRALENKNVKFCGFGDCPNTEQSVCIETRDPLPLNVLSILVKGNVNDA